MPSLTGGYSTRRLQPAAACLLAFSFTGNICPILLRGVCPAVTMGLEEPTRELAGHSGKKGADEVIRYLGNPAASSAIVRFDAESRSQFVVKPIHARQVAISSPRRRR